MSLPDELKFKPEDFGGFNPGKTPDGIQIGWLLGGLVVHPNQMQALIADHANALLAERLGEVRVVRGNDYGKYSIWSTANHNPEDTHTAYLVGVREL